MKEPVKQPKIVFIAQIPPPHIGQSIMHKFLIDADWNKVNKKHIRVELSSNNYQFGTFSFKKIISVSKVIFQMWGERLKGKIDILYYPPSGPVTRKTFYKDLSLLLFTRFLAKKTVFHFHADRFDDLQSKLNRIELILARLIYFKPDLCIVILTPQVQDVKWLLPKKIVVIANGIEDKYVVEKVQHRSSGVRILYVGILIQFKGIEHAIYAAKILKENNCDFTWTFVGGWSSSQFKSKIFGLIEKFDLHKHIIFAGEKIEDERWKYFEKADILCLPTDNDLMPLCVIEGMMMALPIVSTRVRTLPFIVDENINGLLSQPKNTQELASNIFYLYKNKDASTRMGLNGRSKFKACYSIERHLKMMQDAICQLL